MGQQSDKYLESSPCEATAMLLLWVSDPGRQYEALQADSDKVGFSINKQAGGGSDHQGDRNDY